MLRNYQLLIGRDKQTTAQMETLYDLPMSVRLRSLRAQTYWSNIGAIWGIIGRMEETGNYYIKRGFYVGLFRFMGSGLCMALSGCESFSYQKAQCVSVMSRFVIMPDLLVHVGRLICCTCGASLEGNGTSPVDALKCGSQECMAAMRDKVMSLLPSPG